MLDAIALLIFAGLLLYAAASDAASLIIPNWVSAALALAFPPLALADGLPLDQIGVHAAFGFGALIVTFFLFQANVIGGGDAKLIAAVGVWTGAAGFLTFLLSAAIAGGVMAAALMVLRSRVPYLPGAPGFVNRLLEHKAGMPYGLAILVGGWAAIDVLPFVSPLTLP